MRDDGLRGGILREASMGTDSRKDGDKDRRTPVHNAGSDTLRRIEVITGTGRRRRWDAETKARLVAESFEPGRGVSEVARCHDISPSLLFLWRRESRGLYLSEPLDHQTLQAVPWFLWRRAPPTVKRAQL